MHADTLSNPEKSGVGWRGGNGGTGGRENDAEPALAAISSTASGELVAGHPRDHAIGRP